MPNKSYDILRQVIEGRRTVRRYTDAPVPEDDVRRILDAARYAPSSGNEQPWKFLVVRDRKRMDELRDAAFEIADKICTKSRYVIRRAKESLNGIDPVDVNRSYRFEQGFTYELNLSGVSDEARDAFVEGRDADHSR